MIPDMIQCARAAHGTQTAVLRMINDRFSGSSAVFEGRAGGDARLTRLPSEIDVPVHGDSIAKDRVVPQRIGSSGRGR